MGFVSLGTISVFDKFRNTKAFDQRYLVVVDVDSVGHSSRDQLRLRMWCFSSCSASGP